MQAPSGGEGIDPLCIWVGRIPMGASREAVFLALHQVGAPLPHGVIYAGRDTEGKCGSALLFYDQAEHAAAAMQVCSFVN
jgi:hypothetical protein